MEITTSSIYDFQGGVKDEARANVTDERLRRAKRRIRKLH